MMIISDDDDDSWFLQLVAMHLVRRVRYPAGLNKYLKISVQYRFFNKKLLFFILKIY